MNPKHGKKIPVLPKRPRDGHKGTFGRILVIGGSFEMIGAPVFAGTAALRMGSGLVQIAVPNRIMMTALAITPELIGVDREDAGKLAEACRLADVLVVGPGLGRSARIRKLVCEALRLEKDVILDADGLAVLSKFSKWPKRFRARVVLTPHPGEMAKMLDRNRIPKDRATRISLASKYAKRSGQIVVLKGFETIVTDGSRVFVNSTGDTSLAKAGTGDVLSGMIGSLIGQRMPRFEAACLAVHLHGLAGAAAGRKFGVRSALATNVISEISSVVKKYSKGRYS